MQADEDKGEGSPICCRGLYPKNWFGVDDLSLAKRVKSIGAFGGYLLAYMCFSLCCLCGGDEIWGLDRFRVWRRFNPPQLCSVLMVAVSPAASVVPAARATRVSRWRDSGGVRVAGLCG